MTDAMALELTGIVNAAPKTSRMVLLRGAGKDFCIGRATMGQQPAVMPEALEEAASGRSTPLSPIRREAHTIPRSVKAPVCNIWT